jgi:hypothetical protein
MHASSIVHGGFEGPPEAQSADADQKTRQSAL